MYGKAPATADNLRETSTGTRRWLRTCRANHITRTIDSMSLLQVAILAVVQGIAEFLPISSSGHLVVLAALMHDGSQETFDVADVSVVLHVGTLLSIVVFYFHRIAKLLTADRRVAGLLILATLPAVVVGFPIHKWGSKAILSSPLLAGAMLIVTGLMLLWIARRPEGSLHYSKLTWQKSLAIGFGQAFAILPGISRSGTTISMGLANGLTREAAATFSFLMAIPVIAGAGLLEAKDMFEAGWQSTTPMHFLLLGAMISFAVGLIALNWLLKCLQKGKLHWFAYWCIPLGASVVIWQLVAHNS